MPLHKTSRGVLVCLATLAALCVVMDGPMLARLLPWLTGQCSPALGPVSRWNDWWGIGWLRFHNQLVREVAEADKAQGFELIFYGDSITEDWRGTSGGVPWPIGSGGDAVFKKHFSKYRAEVLAIAGDQVGHLWWRVLNGELPKVHQPRVFTMMIGTNDLNAADCNQNETELLAVAPGIADRVGEIVRILRTAAPDAHVLLQAVLPRGAAFVGQAQWQWPNRFSKPIEAINTRFQEMVATDARLHYVDCGPPFIKQTRTGFVLDGTMLPDGLHPNAAGMDVMASCLEAAIAPLMQIDTNTIAPLHEEGTSNVWTVGERTRTVDLASMQDTGSDVHHVHDVRHLQQQRVSNSSILEARVAADA